MKNLIIALRTKHWIKNLLVFLPLVFGNKLFVYPANIKAIGAFLLFCLASSVVYLINDIYDLKNDKKHPTKKMRPFASGKISLQQIQIAIVLLSSFSIFVSFLLNKQLCGILITYIIFNTVYSSLLKNIVIIDVLCIALFFLLRVMAGTAVIGVVYSHWMIFMTCLLAIFLGFNKRRQELKIYKESSEGYRPVLAKYNTYFLDQMISVTTASIVIVYMIYTVDERTVGTFGTNHLFYSIPFVYYGIFRYLYLVHKKNIDGDPTSALLADITTQVNLFLWILACILVVYFRI